MNKESMKCAIEDKLGDAMDEIFQKYQEKLGIVDGGVDPMHTYELDKKVGELAKLVTDILETQKESSYDPVLCGFVWCHGDRDYSAWQVDLSEEDAVTIEGILEKYSHQGCSVRNCYDSKFSEVF